MRWLVVLAAIAAFLIALQVLIWERRGGRSRRSTPGQLAWAVLTLVSIGAAVYAAHWLGIFSIPLVAIAFVPFGIALRWIFLATKATRERAADARAAAFGAPTRRERLLARAAMPVFFVLAAAGVPLAPGARTLVGPH